MRLRFFLWDSADLGVRRSKVSSSFCSAGYIWVSRDTQAACSRPLECPDRRARPGIELEAELQSELNVSRVAGVFHDAEIRSVADIAIGIQELGVIKDVEKLSPELDMLSLSDGCNLLHGKIEIRDP